MNNKEWESKFLEAIEPIHGRCDYHESAEMLRTLVKTKLLKFTDLQNNPERFFAAHRLLMAPNRFEEASGFGVRFTVEFNLFAGSILGLGSPEQVAQLDVFQEKGILGSFCLTEKFAGVNSGLVVETTATWSPERQQFLIETSEESAKKNWISQGLTSSYAVVIADFIIGGKSHGPHGFLVQMRDESTGDLLPGVSVEDMGLKTVQNDLDNARISFKLWTGASSLLSRFAEIQNDRYVQTTDQKMRIEVIGQRLLTGRMAIAEAASMFTEKLFERTRDYASKKLCWAPKGQKPPTLSEIPHIAAIFAEAEEKLNVLNRYNAAVEAELCDVLRKKGIPSFDLVEAIAVSKIKSVNIGVTLTDKLSREVGSYALMQSAGFGAVHFLKCCAFAEGDTRILQQKLARDSMKKFSKSSWTDTGKEIVFGSSAEQQEMKLRFQLSRALSSASSPADAGRLWNENYVMVYDLADAVCARYIAKYTDEECRAQLFAKL